MMNGWRESDVDKSGRRQGTLTPGWVVCGWGMVLSMQVSVAASHRLITTLRSCEKPE
ncbi:hypothetical protein BofuT4_P041280.1 [Botrytis cinerea T4]|uniref:Uncharacterized protein n=1 Tax=Botryotinia fuckeliana (strain T4) TaxID=999810 RepID=G2Y1H7_BOTF4|nr:hypothetical protein BofuT4_P041280.1 [Botrytis cinerea T4]